MKKVGFALALLATTSFSAIAGPSADDAAKLQASLQAYLGTAPETLKVTPDGDGFKAVFDFTAALAAAKADGADVSLSPVELHLTPDGAGKWKVKHEGPFKFSMKLKDQMELEENLGTFTINGTFDEALGTFTDYDATASNITFNETMDDPSGTNVKADGKFDGASVKGTAIANAAGGADLKFTETISTGLIHEVMSGKDNPPLDLQIKFSGGDFTGAVTGAKTSAVPPLLKFLAAHQDKDAMVKDQQALKDMLIALLPVFSNGQGQGTINKIEVQTPMGLAAIDKLTANININGAVKDGHFEEGLSVEGLTLPPGLVPAWAASLVPKNSGFNIAVTGFDAETPARAWLGALDLSKDPPVAPDVVDALMGSFLPKGTVDVTINKTGVSNDTYAFTAEGTFAAGPQAMPTGKAHLTAKGLDEIMKVVQASPPEAGLQSSAALIIAAKGLGKAGSDGALTWDVEATPDGKVTVNGTDMSKFGK
jgi:hypothetical protein